MTVISHDDARRFIRSLDIPQGLKAAETSDDNPADDQTSGASSSIAGGSLVAFDSSVSVSHKKALLNSFGFAHQVTSPGDYSKYHIDPTVSPMDYYKKIIEILSNIGFSSQALEFAEIQMGSVDVTIDAKILDALSSIGPDALANVKLALDALQDDKNKDSLTLYKSHTVNENAGGFSVGHAREDNGSVALGLHAFSLKASRTNTTLFWMKWSTSSASMSKGDTLLDFNDDVYDSVSDDIRRGLRRNAKAFVANLFS